MLLRLTAFLALAASAHAWSARDNEPPVPLRRGARLALAGGTSITVARKLARGLLRSTREKRRPAANSMMDA